MKPVGRFAASMLVIACLSTLSCSAERSTGQAAPTTSTSDAHRELCLSRQKGGYDGVYWAVHRLTRLAASRPEDIPAAAIERARYRVVIQPDETDPPCDAPLTAIREAIESLEPGALDEDALCSVVVELHRWGSALGRRYPPPIRRTADSTCVPQ